MRKRILLCIMVIIFCYSYSMTVCAQNLPDLTRKGSLEIIMKRNNIVVPGGNFVLYRVGDFQEKDGKYSYQLLKEWEPSGANIQNIHTSDTVTKLAEYAFGMKGTEKEISQEGEVLFSNLEPGLYLLLQSKPASGYSKVNPFLISLPEEVNGNYFYELKASPKVGLEPEVTPPPSTPKPSNPPEVSPTPTPQPDKLPQTGQLNWPIPLLAVLGLGLFIVGWILRYGRKGE